MLLQLLLLLLLWREAHRLHRCGRTGHGAHAAVSIVRRPCCYVLRLQPAADHAGAEVRGGGAAPRGLCIGARRRPARRLGAILRSCRVTDDARMRASGGNNERRARRVHQALVVTEVISSRQSCLVRLWHAHATQHMLRQPSPRCVRSMQLPVTCLLVVAAPDPSLSQDQWAPGEGGGNRLPTLCSLAE